MPGHYGEKKKLKKSPAHGTFPNKAEMRKKTLLLLANKKKK